MNRPEKRQPDLTYHHVPGCAPRAASTYRAARRPAARTSKEFKFWRAVQRSWRKLQPLTFVPPKRLLMARERRELVERLGQGADGTS